VRRLVGKADHRTERPLVAGRNRIVMVGDGGNVPGRQIPAFGDHFAHFGMGELEQCALGLELLLKADPCCSSRTRW
jgi:hypothetical protein